MRSSGPSYGFGSGTYVLPETELKKIDVDLQGNKPDAALVTNVLTTILKQNATKNIAYGLDISDPAEFIIKIIGTVNVLQWVHCAQLLELAPTRISEIVINLTKKQICLHVLRGSAELTGLVPYVPPKKRKRCHATIDWVKYGIGDADDQQRIMDITDAVYNMKSCIPEVLSWIECIGADDETDDEELSLMESVRVGYALCFMGFRSIPVSFLKHLWNRYESVMPGLSVWFSLPESRAKEPVLTCCVRRTAVTAADAKLAIESFRPRGWESRFFNEGGAPP